MDFKLWLETKQAITTDIMNAVINSIKLLIGGDWTVDYAKEKMPTWEMQHYYIVKTLGKDVVMQGDGFYVIVFVYVYKRPEDERKEVDWRDLHEPHKLPSWVEDPNQWHNVATYDVQAGHDLIKLGASVYGKRPDKMPEKDDDPDEFFGILDKFSLPHKLGMKNIGGVKTVLSTPYELAQFVKTMIDKFYSGGDNDDDDDGSFDPSPAPSNSRQLVGV